jgi:hypothetical protein
MSHDTTALCRSPSQDTLRQPTLVFESKGQTECESYNGCVLPEMIAAGQSDVGADALLSGSGGNHPANAPLLQDAYHSTIHSAMGYSPCHLLFG